MRFPIRVEKSLRVTRLGVFAMLATFVASLWLATYFLNSLAWILKSDEIDATQQTYVRGYLRAASGDVHNDSTPESAMQAFIDALRKEDIDKALLFVSDTFRDEARNKLQQLKNDDKLPEFVIFLSEMIRGDEHVSGLGYRHPEGIDGFRGDTLFMNQERDGQWRIFVF